MSSTPQYQKKKTKKMCVTGNPVSYETLQAPSSYSFLFNSMLFAVLGMESKALSTLNTLHLSYTLSPRQPSLLYLSPPALQTSTECPGRPGEQGPFHRAEGGAERIAVMGKARRALGLQAEFLTAHFGTGQLPPSWARVIR